MKIWVKKAKGLKGEITLPGDKSITHRAYIMALLARGKTFIKNPLKSEDTDATLNFILSLGAKIEKKTPEETIISSEGMDNLNEPKDVLNAMNSGTTARLFSGVLSGCSFFSVITGDDSLKRRPMERVTLPLREMGAKIYGRKNASFLPIAISGGNLKGIRYKLPVASAQVKSALLLAGLFADGETEIEETIKSRDHTERMLKHFGVKLDMSGDKIKIKGGQRFSGREVVIPGDVSSASFFIAAGTIVENSEIVIKDVGLNETRTGFIRALLEMGGEIKIEDERIINEEKVGNIIVRSAKRLKGISISKEMVPTLIDEIPLLALVACFAEGETIITGAEELKKKESDRLFTTVDGLKRLGADVEPLPDGMIIRGGKKLKGGEVESYGDHRIAMTFAIGGLAIEEGVYVNDFECVSVSFPEFLEKLEALKK
jgi:3-phosphoshikimate 1-carboxyvinyltransferase